MSSSSEKSKNITGARLSLVRGFGAASLSRDSVFFLSNSKVAYMCGQRLVFHDITSGDMSFFKRSKSMPVVSSMALDGSRKVLALCEGGKERGGRALLSFYNTSTGARIKAITNNASNGNIVTCAFGPNGKEFVTVSEAPDCTLAVWQWSSSKCVQHVKIGSQVTRVRVNPLNSREFTTSGPEYLRMWRLEATSMKSTALVKPAKKEQEGNFLDHVWTKQKLLAVLSSERILVLKYNKDLQTCEPVFSIEFDEVYKDSRDFSSPKTISRYNKGFCVGGEKGSLAVYERSGDPKEPYVLIKTFRGHEYDTISCLATSPNNENVACMNTSGTINMFPLSFVDTLDDTKDNFFKDLVYRGIHRKEISSLDVSVSRPILVTCDTSDRQISIWNYLNWKCEFTKELPSDPTCVALHPSGFIVLVATKARVKLYNIGMTKLITMSDIPGIKHCKVARFSNGGQYFACSSGITNIVIYSTFQSQHLHTLVGHIAFVRGLDWSADDSKLYSVGADGGVYGWRTSDGKRDSEMVVKNCRFTDVVTSRDGSTAAMVGDDGRMHYRVGDEYYSFECGDGLIVNSLVLPKCETYIVTGMSNGAIRVYPWPLPRMSNVMPGVISEIHLHSNAVTNLRISIDQKYLFSASKKGVLMVSAVKQMMSSQVEIPFEKPHRSHYNADTVVQLREDVEETKLNVIRLNNTIGDVMSKSKFQLQLMKTEWQDKLKDHIEESKQESSIQSGQYKKLQSKHENAINDHKKTIQTCKDSYEKKITGMEDLYDRKLSIEMARYDKLSEDMELLRMHCEEALRQQEDTLQVEIDAMLTTHRKQETKYREELQQLKEDLRENVKKFEEERRQQESEYEQEIQTLKQTNKRAVEREWKEQAKKEAEIMEQKNKMKKKTKKITSLKQENLHSEEKNRVLQRKTKDLESLLKHRDLTIQEMKATLGDKEKEILNLRANNRKLNNFRYVLDNKIEELTMERKPAAEHIAKLEAHIKDMYDELVNEFSEKKQNDRLMNKKDLKIDTLTKEVHTLRGVNRDRERMISAFLSRLSNAVKVSNPKDAQDALKGLYRAFVKKEGLDDVIKSSEDSGDTAEVGTLKETLRQRAHMAKTCATLKRTMKLTEEKMRSQTKRSMAQNALLINECNKLRKENKLTKIMLQEMQERNKILERQKRKWTNDSKTANRKVVTCPPVSPKSPAVHHHQQHQVEERQQKGLTPFLRRKAESPSRRKHGGRLAKGSTMGTYRDSQANTKLRAMENDLSESQREIEMQRLEIRRLRNQVSALLHEIPAEQKEMLLNYSS